MRLKTFQAKSMSDAMRQIKETLGEDAIIVSSRDEPSGGVRVTAAVEQVNPEPERLNDTLRRELPVEPAPSAFDDPDLIAERVTDTLLRHRVPTSVSDKLLTNIMIQPPADTRTALSRALSKTFGFRPLMPAQAAVPLMLVGAPGAGKTLMTAKLAADYVMQGQRPFVITTDTARAGGVEQLKAFLDIMQLPLGVAATAAQLQEKLLQAPPGAAILIDTGGLNPFDGQEMKDLARLIAVQRMETALVMAAGTDAEESAEMAMAFEILGVSRLIPTRLDFTRRLGGLLSAAERAALSFTCASHTSQVAHGIMPLSADALADMLLPAARGSDTVTTPSRKGRA